MLRGKPVRLIDTGLKYILKGIDTILQAMKIPYMICLKYILKGIDTPILAI